VVFFVLALFLGYLQDQVHKKNSAFEKKVEQKQQMQMPISTPKLATPPVSQPATPPVSQPAAAPANNLTAPMSAPTNTPEAPTQSK